MGFSWGSGGLLPIVANGVGRSRSAQSAAAAAVEGEDPELGDDGVEGGVVEPDEDDDEDEELSPDELLRESVL
jgi:hypothetical protein